jgi:hypothetical protein
MKLFIILISILVITANFESKSAETDSKIEVVYFHGTTRCDGCIAIEKFTVNSLNSNFESKLKDSSMIFTTYDFLLPENEHFQKDYKFDTQTLVIRKIVNGKEVKWKNLDKIWDYYSNYEKFNKYISKEIKKFIK